MFTVQTYVSTKIHWVIPKYMQAHDKWKSEKQNCIHLDTNNFRYKKRITLVKTSEAHQFQNFESNLLYLRFGVMKNNDPI